MCGVISQVLSESSNNIIYSSTIIDEEEDILSDADLKAMKRDKAFWHIWTGGVLRASLEIRSRAWVDEKGRLFLNGRRFTRSSWGWRPPAIIRDQGRMAKDYPDPMNFRPSIIVEDEDGKPVRRDTCPCGGQLLKDRRGYLYCTKCNIIYE